jgi:hypothetical protein
VSGETEASVSGWTVDTLREYIMQRLTDMRGMLDERYATQTKALDAAFLAQQTAMRTALEAAEKAVQAALVSAGTAVVKAEVAAEKRFESVNEFRAQLTDQAATFVSRVENDTRLGALAEKLDTETKRNSTTINEVELRLTSRLDLMTGRATGADTRQADTRLNIGALLQGLAVVAAFITVIFVILHK